MSRAMKRDLPGVFSHGPTQYRITAKFIYDEEDPYAVRILFGNGAEWWLDRESLRQGMLYGYVGDGETLVYSDLRQVEIMQCHIVGPGECAMFGYDKLMSLMYQAYRMVPRGEEYKLIDWDGLLTYAEGAQ